MYVHHESLRDTSYTLYLYVDLGSRTEEGTRGKATRGAAAAIFEGARDVPL